MNKEVKQLTKELHQVYFMLNFTLNPVEFDTLLQRATQLEKQIQQLQHEEYGISGCKGTD